MAAKIAASSVDLMNLPSSRCALTPDDQKQRFATELSKDNELKVLLSRAPFRWKLNAIVPLRCDDVGQTFYSVAVDGGITDGGKIEKLVEEIENRLIFDNGPIVDSSRFALASLRRKISEKLSTMHADANAPVGFCSKSEGSANYKYFMFLNYDGLDDATVNLLSRVRCNTSYGGLPIYLAHFAKTSNGGPRLVSRRLMDLPKTLKDTGASQSAGIVSVLRSAWLLPPLVFLTTLIAGIEQAAVGLFFQFAAFFVLLVAEYLTFSLTNRNKS